MKPDPYDYEMYLWSNDTAYCDEEGNLDGSLNSDKSKEVFSMFQDRKKTDMQLLQKNQVQMNS